MGTGHCRRAWAAGEVEALCVRFRWGRTDYGELLSRILTLNHNAEPTGQTTTPWHHLVLHSKHPDTCIRGMTALRSSRPVQDLHWNETLGVRQIWIQRFSLVNYFS
jgi:hypothetical protein